MRKARCEVRTRMKAQGGLIVAAVGAAAGYAMLARVADGPALGWLLGAQAIGWAALAWAWRMRSDELNTPGALAIIVVAAGVFRALGLGTVPSWEDDYFRHLWDGWMTWRTGSPYGVAPLAWFGVEGTGAGMGEVLDGVNYPEHATIYGPVAQAWSAAAAGLAELTGAVGLTGRLAIFKAGLVAAEAAGLWALWRVGGGRALLFAAWCPLAVTEIAFAGHVDAWVLATLAGAVALTATKHQSEVGRGRGRGRELAACGLVALACATKAYALLLAPFFLWRAGWRGAGVFAAVVGAAYVPWMVATWQAGREVATVWGGGGVAAMAGGFEFNSSGYAVLAWTLGDVAGRWAAGGLLVGGWGWMWVRWAAAQAGKGCLGQNRLEKFVTKLVTKSGGGGGGLRDAREERTARMWAVVPGVGVVGWWALWSPVFHPWYALMALPFLALRPSGWGVGLLAALPLSYVHGLTLGAGASGDYRHPVWVRPAEALGVAVGALVARWRGASGTQ